MKEKEILEHLKDMFERMPSQLDNPYKFNRWLGFVQGCLYSINYYAVEDLKTHNKKGLRYALMRAEQTVRKILVNKYGKVYTL